MASELYYIPEGSFDHILNKEIERADEVIISVSFVFISGLGLIIDSLKKIKDQSRLTIIISNYLKSSEPGALLRLLELRDLGANIYLYDSIGAKRSFHMKSFLFSTKSSDTLIVGSSNISLTAFQKGHELNLSSRDQEICGSFRRIINNLIKDPYLQLLDRETIDKYIEIYEANRNPFIDNEYGVESAKERADVSLISPNRVQYDALEILRMNRDIGITKGLIILATGLGKTYLSALDAKQFGANRLLFVAHREEILNQSIESFRKVMPDKTYGLYKGDDKDTKSDFLFASIQTLGKQKNLSDFDPTDFDYIIVDEFHHVGAKSYKALINYFNPKFFLGLTATPNRTDNIDILQYCGDNIIYRKDLIDGINYRLLSNFEYHGINDKHVDYTKITWRKRKFDLEELDKNLVTISRTAYILEEWKKLKQFRTLGFCSSIRHCDHMSNYFNQQGYRTLSVHSQSEVERSDAINKLKNREIDAIFSVDIFNEGVDIPEVDTILMARPTESKIIFMQQLGRGLRLSPGKDIVRIIDFIGNHKSFLNKPSALMGIEPTNANVREFIDEYKSGKLELPSDSRILYDTESLDFMEALIKIKNDYNQSYLDYKESTGTRPSASDFHQFIGKIKEIRQKYNSWFHFVKEMGDLNNEDETCFNEYEFFTSFLEETRMTLSFKMVTLQIMLKNEFEPISIEELSRRSFLHLRGSIDLWGEVKSDLQFKDLDEKNNLQKWVTYWKSNPISALTQTEPMFKLDRDVFSLTFEIDETLKSSFIKLSEEIINYRFLNYSARSDSSYIQMGDPFEPISSQLHKAFNKIDTPKLFGWDKFSLMTGFWHHSENNPNQAIYITLIKSGFQVEHRYHDYFINGKRLRWQSQKKTGSESDESKKLMSHDKVTHLFVRKSEKIFNGTENITAPFTYCGIIKNVSNITGSKPIQVEFDLEHELPERLRQQFLRI